MKTLIYGNKISGKGACHLANILKIDNEYIDDSVNESILDGVDRIVVSPSVPMDKPIINVARDKGIEVIGELEFGYRYTKGNIIAITGTNGKTTTSMMIDNLYREQGIAHHLLGNVGKSLSRHALDTKEDDKVVVEVSSYQLEGIKTFRPHIAIMLNISEDHLERHGSMENYVNTKKRIFENMKKEDLAILNHDDDIVREMSKDIKAKVKFFSMKEKVEGAYLQDRWVYYDGEKLFSVKDMHQMGEHNVANALALVVVAKYEGIPNYMILRSLRSFSLPPHRIQFIGKLKGKNYYNDSKATNIDATLRAIECMKGSTCLIIGGYDKGISYKRLFDEMDKCVRSIVIFGQNRKSIEETIKDYDVRYFVVDTLLRAIKRASKERCENVLFSPATSSYDMFNGYEERGDMFVKLALDINEA